MSVQQAGSATPVTIGTLQLATFINPAGLQSLGENLYGETAASGTPSSNAPGSNGAGMLNQGYVETSNVNVVEELVNMIQTQRAYEINSKAIQTSDQMLQRLTQLVRLVMNRLSKFGLVGVLLGLVGCGTTPSSIVQQPTTARPQAQPVQVASNGTIYQAATYRPMFEDRRARHVGDMLTIAINEKTQASKKASSKA